MFYCSYKEIKNMILQLVFVKNINCFWILNKPFPKYAYTESAGSAIISFIFTKFFLSI